MSSTTLKLIGDINAIIYSLEDEPDTSEINYLDYTTASLVSKRYGSNGKVSQLSCSDMEMENRYGE